MCWYETVETGPRKGRSMGAVEDDDHEASQVFQLSTNVYMIAPFTVKLVNKLPKNINISKTLSVTPVDV